MNNKPNMYRVNYQVMEGNNYAGGWGKRTKDVKELGEAGGFRNVTSVQPIYIEIGEAIADEVINRAAVDMANNIARNRKLLDVARAENKLAEAKAALN